MNQPVLQRFTEKNFSFYDFEWPQNTKDESTSSKKLSDYYHQENIHVWTCGFDPAERIWGDYKNSGENLSPGYSSFIVFDVEKEMILSGRCLMGNFPLFYSDCDSAQKEHFIFGFSINALLRSDAVDLQINHSKIKDFILYDSAVLPDNHTFFKHIHRVLPGFIYCIKKDPVSKKFSRVLKPFHKLNIHKYASFTDEQYISRLKDLFVSSVARHVKDHKIVAATLSGGLDSSSICCVAQSLKDDPVQTFNYNPGIAAMEDEYIEAVVDKCHNRHATIKPSVSDYESLTELTRLNGQPLYTLNHTIHLELIKAAKKSKAGVFLSGHFGDQVIAHGSYFLDELYESGSWEDLKTALIQNEDHSIYIIKSMDSWHSEDKSLKHSFNAINFFIGKLPKRGRWFRLPLMLWILMRHFNCKPLDFLKYLKKKITLRKSHLPVGALFHDEILRKIEKERADNPSKSIDLTQINSKPLSNFQQKHLNSIMRVVSILGQEEYFEVYRQKGLIAAQPFFDADLIELTLATPNKLKFSNGKKRGTLRRAMKEYLPEAVAQRDTKGEFSAYHTERLIGLHEEFMNRTSPEHQIWKIIDKNVYNRNLTIISDKDIPVNSKKKHMFSVLHTIKTAIWLDQIKINDIFLS